MPYFWTVTTDHIADPERTAPSNSNAHGMTGPRNVTMSSEEIQKHPDAQQFRIYDDDGELYYTGFMVEDDSAEGEDPLTDFGEPNAGATRLDVKEGRGWQTWIA